MLKKILPYITLFSTVGTLVCCALPALFVSLGLGATFVSVLGVFPQLIWFSEHKMVVFGVAGTLLSAAGVLKFNSKALECPTDRELAASCQKTRAVSNVIFYISVVLYCVGGFFAFVAPHLF